MSAATVFLMGLAIALASALVVVMYLRRPLKTILVDLCGTVERGILARVLERDANPCTGHICFELPARKPASDLRY